MKKTFMKILIFNLLSIITLNIYAQNLTWDYPIKPGTEKWKSYQNTPDIVRDLQMPDKALKSISTEELLKVCLKYPFFSSYTASNSPFEGLNRTLDSFNGFDELSNRKDASDILFNFYINKQVLEIDKTEKGMDKAGFSFYYCGYELLLCNKKIVAKFSKEQQTDILKLFMKRNKEKDLYKDSFGFFGKMTSAFVANRYAVMLGKKETNVDSKTDNAKKLFAERMIISDPKVVDNVLAEVEIFVNQLK
jgi:hypothetical protein